MATPPTSVTLTRKNELLTQVALGDIADDVSSYEKQGTPAKFQDDIYQLISRYSALLRINGDDQFNERIKGLEPRLVKLKSSVDFRKGASNFFKPISFVVRPVRGMIKGAIDGIRGDQADTYDIDKKVTIGNYLVEREEDLKRLENNPTGPDIQRELDEISKEIPLYKAYNSKRTLLLEDRIQKLRPQPVAKVDTLSVPSAIDDPQISVITTQIEQLQSKLLPSIEESRKMIQDRSEKGIAWTDKEEHGLFAITEQIAALNSNIRILKIKLNLIPIENAIQTTAVHIQSMQPNSQGSTSEFDLLKRQLKDSIEALKLRRDVLAILSKMENANTKEEQKKIEELMANTQAIRSRLETLQASS